jgi:hypothetical protein
VSELRSYHSDILQELPHLAERRKSNFEGISVCERFKRIREEADEWDETCEEESEETHLQPQHLDLADRVAAESGAGLEEEQDA